MARKLAPNRNVEREILKIGRIMTKSCTYTVQYLTVKFVLEILCKIVELPDVLVSISVLDEDELSLSLEGSFVATRRPELEAPAAYRA